MKLYKRVVMDAKWKNMRKLETQRTKKITLWDLKAEKWKQVYRHGGRNRTVEREHQQSGEVEC